MTQTEATDIEIASVSIMDAHRELHHYTTFNGLKGIVDTNSLFATHYRDLNDTSEVFHLKGRLVAELVPRFQAIAEKRPTWKSDWSKSPSGNFMMDYRAFSASAGWTQGGGMRARYG